MRRRAFMMGLAGALLAARDASGAQERVPVIGVLWHAGSPEAEQPYFDALVRGFHDLGYVDGKTIKFEHRFPNESPDRFRDMAEELVALKVDAIVAVGSVTAPFVKKATSDIPIVFLFAANPVGSGLVKSLARPGGNITGLTQIGTDLTAKRFELLRELVPSMSRVALLMNPAEPSASQYLKEGAAAALQLGLTVLPFELRALDQIQAVFEKIKQAQTQAVAFAPGGLLFHGRDELHNVALAYKMPTCGWSREIAASGHLLSYGADQVEMAHHVSVLVDKILRGIRPGQIAVEQPTRFQLIVNLKTATALGLTIPETFLSRADEVIE
ncbi:MAG TPA: ABC transporter substrate-binding protein [Bradyrhizobium sp.]|nr:ABC transporter substrate-binding protein [Bradyrhizobium sp.]